MGKILTAEKVKKLSVGTDVKLVQENTNKCGFMYVIKYGRKKMLRGMFGLHEITDRPGWHYELMEES